MRTKLLLVASLLVALALLSGCGKKSPSSLASPGGSDPTVSATQASVAGTLSQVPQVVEDGEAESPDTTGGGDTDDMHFGPRDPFHFWRSITNVTRSFQFAFADTDTSGKPTRAQVTVDKVLTGRFNVLRFTVVMRDSMPRDSFYVVHKPLEDHWVRRVLLERRPGSDDWHVTGVSGVQVTSQNAATRITSLRVQGGSLDTTLTDPLAFLYLRRVFRFMPGDSVTLTVTTLRNDDLVFLMLRDHRHMFHNNGDDTYTARLLMPYREGLRHFGVNALSHGTILVDADPYDSQEWLFPYVVFPDMMAAQLP